MFQFKILHIDDSNWLVRLTCTIRIGEECIYIYKIDRTSYEVRDKYRAAGLYTDAEDIIDPSARDSVRAAFR